MRYLLRLLLACCQPTQPTQLRLRNQSQLPVPPLQHCSRPLCSRLLYQQGTQPFRGCTGQMISPCHPHTPPSPGAASPLNTIPRPSKRRHRYRCIRARLLCLCLSLARLSLAPLASARCCGSTALVIPASATAAQAGEHIVVVSPRALWGRKVREGSKRQLRSRQPHMCHKGLGRRTPRHGARAARRR